MISERQEELASLYALDLLEGDEHAQFEAELARDPGLQQLVRELRETSSALAHTAPAAPAPAALKTRALESISKSQSRVLQPPAAIFRGFIPWAVAACFAFVAAWMGARYAAARTEADLLRQQQALAQTTLKGLSQQLEAERILNHRQVTTLVDQIKSQSDLASLKIAALTSMLKNSPDAIAVAVWDSSRQEGVFTLEKTPPLTADQKLELWVVAPGEGAKPISAGILNVSAEGTARLRFKPSAPVGAIAAFAVSRENNDGVAFHTSPAEVVMLGHSR